MFIPTQASQRPRRASRSYPREIENLSIARWIAEFCYGLPPLEGSPIALEFLPVLTAHRGKLLSGSAHKGRPVHAASFLRERRIVLEDELLDESGNLRLILTHELFHFVWFRLGPYRQREFRELIAKEREQGARGAAGESSHVAKEALGTDPHPCERLWRSYVCESFCDTAACLYGGLRSHPQWRLAARWSVRRAHWFQQFSRFAV